MEWRGSGRKIQTTGPTIRNRHRHSSGFFKSSLPWQLPLSFPESPGAINAGHTHPPHPAVGYQLDCALVHGRARTGENGSPWGASAEKPVCGSARSVFQRRDRLPAGPARGTAWLARGFHPPLARGIAEKLHVHSVGGLLLPGFGVFCRMRASGSGSARSARQGLGSHRCQRTELARAPPFRAGIGALARYFQSTPPGRTIASRSARHPPGIKG